MNKVKVIKAKPIKQQGIATIVTSIALLMLVTLTVAFTANVGIMETKTSANEYRSAQAFFSAQAGIDYVLAKISKYEMANPSLNPDISLTNVGGNSYEYSDTVNYDDGSTTTGTGSYVVSIDYSSDTTNYELIKLTATGTSGDTTSTASIEQEIVFSAALPYGVQYFFSAPLITKGNAEITLANITEGVINKPSGLGTITQIKVHSGGSISDGGAPASTNGTNINFREGDSTINAYSNSTMHSKVFNLDTTGMKQMSRRASCSGSCSNPSYITNNSSYSRSKMHFVDGANITLSGGSLGSSTDPVILYVDTTSSGNLILKTGITVWGLVFVKGNWNNNSNSATINGAVVVTGNLTNGENLTISHDNTTFNNLGKVGTYTRLPGSWSDTN